MASAALKDVSLAFAGRPILEGVNFMVRPGDRIALTGPNGSGKSTLLRVLAGLLAPDSGSVEVQKGTRTVYLPQAVIGQEGAPQRRTTVHAEADAAFEELNAVAAEMGRIEEQLGHDESLLDHYGHLADLIERSGYYEKEQRIESVLRGLGFHHSDFQRPVGELSGGWQMRVALAKVLLSQADILLLDEPTNYLDLRARTWLEEYLAACAGAVVLVAHDRAFLDAACTRIADLQKCRIKLYRGGYSAYESARSAELEGEAKAFDQQQEEIERIESFIRKFRFNASKARLVQSRIRYLEGVARLERPSVGRTIKLNFPAPPRCGHYPVKGEGLSRRYGDLQVFSGVDLEITRGERVAIVGDNGAGKSTLVRLLAGVEAPTSGEVVQATGVLMGYLAQDGDVQLDDSLTVLETVSREAPQEVVPQVRSLLGSFLFSGEDVDKPVGVLSGGERSRVAMARLLLRPTNVLILDEPTNHLDIASTGVLAAALGQYRGTLIFVSHDRSFIRQLATMVIEVADGGATVYPGDLDYYAWKKGQVASPAKPEARPVAASQPPPANGSVRPPLSKNERARLEARERELVGELEQLTAQQGAIQVEMGRPDVYPDGDKMRVLSQRLIAVLEREGVLTAEWEAVASRKE